MRGLCHVCVWALGRALETARLKSHAFYLNAVEGLFGSNHSLMGKFPNWLKWVILLPSAIIVWFFSYCVISFVFSHIIAGDNGYGDITSFSTAIRIGDCTGCLLGSMSLIYWVHYLSPQYKRITTLIVTSITLLLGIALIIGDIDLIKYGHYFEPMKHFILIVGSILGALTVGKE